MSYNSHYSVLAGVVAGTQGPILELGAGDGSTPMLHYIASTMDRPILTADTNAEWLAKYVGYGTHLHTFKFVEGWKEFKDPFERIGCIFIDCAPGEAREHLARRYKNRADFVVCHDSEKDYASGGNYQYEKVIPEFKHVSEFRRFRPYTLIMSNVRNFHIPECDRTWTPPQ